MPLGNQRDVEKLPDTQLYRRDGSGETFHESLYPFVLYEDFTAAASTGLKVVLIDVSSSGDSTPDPVTDERCGVWDFKLDSTDEAQESGFSMGDNLMIPVGSGKCIAEMRVKIKVLPSASTASMVFGLASADNATILSTTHRLWFRLNGSGAIVVDTDDGTTADEGNATGITATADDKYRILRVEYDPVAKVATFYIDNVLVYTSDAGDLDAFTSTTALQIVAKCDKTGAGTDSSVGTFECDYVKVFIPNRPG